MSQHDQVLANQAGAAFRSDLNDALAALWNLSSGATEPATKTAYMFWADTTSGLLKQRNAANSAWLNVGLMAAHGLGMMGTSTVAAHATTADIWAGSFNVLLSGAAVTFTALAAAPAAGYLRRVRLNTTHTFTDGATFEVQGNANYTGVDGDYVWIYAKTTSTFSVMIEKADGTAVVAAGAPAVGDITGLGAGVATAMGIAVGSAGAPVVLNGALGTPSSGNLANCTGYPALSTDVGNLGVGMFAMGAVTGSTVAAGGTTASFKMLASLNPGGPSFAYTSALAGTWKNVSGATVDATGSDGVGAFQRIS